MSRLTQILRGKKIKPLTEMESAVKYAIDNAGSGGGSSLPAVTSADNGDLLGVVEGAWAKVKPTTGGETFTVTLTFESDAWTADKTIAEILEAYEVGKRCVATTDEDDLTLEFDLCAVANGAVQFNSAWASTDTKIDLFSGFVDGGDDIWMRQTTKVSAELPAVTSSDNGSLLGVTNGNWAKVDPPTEIIYVPFTVTENQGTYTATTDANYLDVETAALAGKSVVARCTGLASSIVDVPLEAVATNGTSIHFSRVIYLGTAVLFFWASWTPMGVSVTVKQITAT